MWTLFYCVFWLCFFSFFVLLCLLYCLKPQTYWLVSSCTISCWPHIESIGSTIPCLHFVWKLHNDLEHKNHDISWNIGRTVVVFFFLLLDFIDWFGQLVKCGQFCLLHSSAGTKQKLSHKNIDTDVVYSYSWCFNKNLLYFPVTFVHSYSESCVFEHFMLHIHWIWWICYILTNGNREQLDSRVFVYMHRFSMTNSFCFDLILHKHRVYYWNWRI